MNEITPHEDIVTAAKATVERILGETDKLPLNPFAEHAHKPYEFKWVRYGVPEAYDYVYEKKQTAPVIQAKTVGSRKGKPVTRGTSRLTGVSAHCPLCESTHPVLAPCN